MADELDTPAPQRPDPYARPVAVGPTMSARAASAIDARVNPNALIGLITGVVSVFFNLLFLVAPVAIVFSALGIARGRLLRSQGAPKTLLVHAYVGLGCGILAAVIGLIQIVVFLTTTLTVSVK